MKAYQRSLIVGKFAPLHLGHNFLISRAIELSEELIIFSYTNPEYEGCNPERRLSWLNSLYPNAKSFVFSNENLQMYFPHDQSMHNLLLNLDDENEHRVFVAKAYNELIQKPLDAVFTSEDYGNGFAEIITKYLQMNGLQTYPVKHIEVDKKRIQFPISASKIRDDIHGHYRMMNPLVYRDFIESVCFLGGESTGKSTLASSLAELYRTSYIEEYGRYLWEVKNGKLIYEDFLHIAQTQIANEEKSKMNAHKYIFADTSPLTTLFYSYSYTSKADPKLIDLSNRTYQHYFLCAPDFPFVQDGTRADESFRQEQHQWYLDTLTERKIPFTLLTGSFEDRLKTVIKILN